ncbi:LOW QUALITY PROTEIN: somatostatin-2-like [Pholidichthys leucotaenia]
MDFCLTRMSQFLHPLAAHQLSINCTTSCDPWEEEEQGPSKEQQLWDLDQRESRTSTGTSRRLKTTAGMQCVRCSAVLVLVALVLCSPRVSSQQDRDMDLDLDLDLRHHRLLQRARSAGLLSQEWSKRAVEDLLAQMSLPEAGAAQQEAEMVSTVTGGRMNLERSVDPPNNNNSNNRERKGCKNFFWKGLTSC